MLSVLRVLRKYNGMTYSVDFDIPLSDTFLEKVCDVKSETANGLTYITVDLEYSKRNTNKKTAIGIRSLIAVFCIVVSEHHAGRRIPQEHTDQHRGEHQQETIPHQSAGSGPAAAARDGYAGMAGGVAKA